MINGVHTLIYTTQPEAMRAFFRDVLELPYVEARDGWLIFALPPAEVAFHPIEAGHEHHEITLMCDDIEGTVGSLRERGVTFDGDVADQGWGLTIMMALPAGSRLMLYQPRHPLAARIEGGRSPVT